MPTETAPAAGVAAAGDLLAGLARAHYAAFRIELVGGLGDAVEVELGGELDAGVARADHRGDDRLDLLAHPPLVGDLALVGADAAAGFVAAAVGQKPAGFVDDRDALRFQPVDRAGDQMADRRGPAALRACRGP